MKEFYKELDEYIESLEDKKNDYKILSFVVDEIGYLNDDIIKYIANKIDVFPFTLEGTIKYYPKLQKAAIKNYIQICIGRNCSLKNLKEKIVELRAKTGFTIDERNCLGCCGKGSVFKVGENTYRYKTLDELEEKILNLK